MSTTGFDRNEIIELLSELGRRLSAKGVAGQLYIVGGAAMALEFDTRAPRETSTRSFTHPPRWLKRPHPWPPSSAYHRAG
jgi:hypothetical protein